MMDDFNKEPVILDSHTITDFDMPLNNSDSSVNNHDYTEIPMIENSEDINSITLVDTVNPIKNDDEYVQKMIDDKLDSISKRNNIYGVGKVVAIKDFIIEVVGLEGVSFNEKVTIENKGIGYVIQMKPNRVCIALLSLSCGKKKSCDSHNLEFLIGLYILFI